MERGGQVACRVDVGILCGASFITCARTVTTACVPAVDQRICCSLFMRRFTRVLARPSEFDLPTFCPARWSRA